MSAERPLLDALDGLTAPVTVWWRDDDAGRDDGRLHRLLDLAKKHEAPLALAVVPAWLDEAAAAAIAGCPQALVLQHGIAHADHSTGGRKIELGGGASPAALEAGLLEGRRRLRAAFGRRFLPVLVPPWNRIADPLVARLPALGYAGLSRFGPRPAALAAPGLREVSTHLDLILWREGRRPLRLAEAAAGLARALQAAPGEPIGLLSHHLVMDEEAFLVLDRLLTVLQDHPWVRRLGDARSLFGEVE